MPAMQEEKPEGKWRKKCRKPLKHPFLAGMLVTFSCMVIVLALLLYLPVFSHVKKPNNLSSYRKIHAVQRLIDQYFIGDVDQELEADYLLKGMVSALGDKYSAYYSKEEYETIARAQQGMYLGIGISIDKDEEDGYIVIVGVMEEGPAQEAGLRVDDKILSINETDTREITVSEASALISNAESDEIVLEISREGEKEPWIETVSREELEITNVYGGMIGETIGYIRITRFTALVPDQYSAMYDELEKNGMDRLVIDLRGNPGGLVNSACDTLRQILPKGLIYYSLDKDENRTEAICDGENEIQIPLVVLVDENSASASEIFAGAIKDYGIGTVVGGVTYGKGIVQTTYELSDGSAVKLTVSHYYTPKGNDIHGVGITPDVEVEMDEDSEEDLQLEKAVEIISET